MNSFTGVVQKGARRGRALGFPTINIPLIDTKVSGIYAARVSVQGQASHMAAVYADPKRRVLEAHILDFSDDLYGTEAEVELLEKIREDKTFDSESELRAAIADDVAKVRKYFQNDVE